MPNNNAKPIEASLAKKDASETPKIYPMYNISTISLPEFKLDRITLLSDANPQDLISDEHLRNAFKRSSSAIQRSIKNGEFPQPARVGNTNYWFAEDLVKHLKQQQKIAQDEHDRLKKAEHALLP